MPSHRYFAGGDHNAVCDICGRAFKFSRLQKTWDGFWACDQDWYPRNPQEYFRGIPDDQSVQVNRPQILPTVMNIYEAVQNDAVSYYTTPSSSALSIAGDITFIARVSMGNWQLGVDVQIFSKTDFTRTIDCYFFLISSGFLQVQLSPDGSGRNIWTSTVPISAVSGSILYLKAVYVKVTGTVTFSTSVDGATYTALGTPVFIGVTTIFTSAAPLIVGLLASGSGNPIARIYSAQILAPALVGSFVASDYPLPGILPMTSFNSILTGEKYTPVLAALITGVG